jgi:prephenate dehydratase
MSGVIAFQGVPGAYSDLACRSAYPGFATLPCPSFEAAIAAVHEGSAELAMLPCENSLAGRVPDIHRMLPSSGLFVVGEHYQRVEHCLLANKGATLSGIRRAHSHPVALGQVLNLLREMKLEPVIEADTAGAAKLLPKTAQAVTTFVFRVRNIPAALYKALGGFATNGVNMTKLESYMLDGHFTATQFLCDVDGHPDQPELRRALEELEFFSKEMRVLGTYAAHPYRFGRPAEAD